MLKYLCRATLVALPLFTGSCKKDLLHLQNIQKLNANTASKLDNIRFVSDNICLVAGGMLYEKSEILRSTDGGYTWSSYSSPEAQKEMLGMGISPNGIIYLSGVDGDVLHSKDSGKTWQFNRIGNWLVYSGGAFVNADTGFFVSSVLQRQSTITRVDASFKIIDEQTFLFGLNRIYMTSASTGYVIGYGAVMKTTDHGNTWNFQDVHGDNFTAMDLHGDVLWMCGSNGSIYHSDNGGISWQTLRNGNDISLPRYYLRCILFKDKKNGWAAGDDGKLIYTKDGGAHWSEYEHFTSNNIRALALCPNKDLLVAGDNGTLFRLSVQ